MSSLVARSDFYRSVVCLVALAVSGLALPAVLWASTSADTWAADYERSKERRFTAEAIPVPADGLVLEHGSATWRLESGTLRLQEPAADGTVTGLVFEGRGRFVFEVADPVELAQLRRVAERPDLDGVDTAFTELVLRTTEPFLGEMFPPADNESYAAGEKLAEERHEHWLDRRRDDVDARVVCGLAMPGDAYLQAGIKTDDFDWLTYRYDALEPEEIVLVKYQPRNGFVEEWVRLDRAEDRRPDGRPSSESRRLIDVVDIDVNVDLTVAAKRLSPIRVGEIQPRLGAFEVGVRFVPAVDGPSPQPPGEGNVDQKRGA